MKTIKRTQIEMPQHINDIKTLWNWLDEEMKNNEGVNIVSKRNGNYLEWPEIGNNGDIVTFDLRTESTKSYKSFQSFKNNVAFIIESL